MNSNADAYCPCCGAQEPDWNGPRSDPTYADRDAEIERLSAQLESLTISANHERATRRHAESEIERLRAALKQIDEHPGFAGAMRKIATDALAALEQRGDGK